MLHLPEFFFSLIKKFQIKEAIFKTLISNGMFDNAHIRLTLTRGKKVISCRVLTHMRIIQYPLLFGNDSSM